MQVSFWADSLVQFVVRPVLCALQGRLQRETFVGQLIHAGAFHQGNSLVRRAKLFLVLCIRRDRGVCRPAAQVSARISGPCRTQIVV